MMSPALLCIDDRPEWLKSLKNTLGALGHIVCTATDESMAEGILERVEVSVVFVEYKPEGMDAEAVALHLKQHFPNHPKILLSALPEIPDRILWLVDDYLMNSPLDLLPESIGRVMRQTQKAHTAA